LPADYTFTAGDAGVHTFSNGVTLKTAGTKTVTATDKTTNSITGSVSVTVNAPVNPVATTLTISPRNGSVVPNGTLQFSDAVTDQFGNPYTATPVSWTVTGGGTIDNTGKFTAGSATGGPFTVAAATGGLTATASVTISTTVNLAPNGAAYRWFGMSNSTAITNQTAAPGLNDNNLTTDVVLTGGSDDVANAYEAAGVIWSASQSVNKVTFTNGSFNASTYDGVFDNNFGLQTTTDGITWTNVTGWSLSPAYQYDLSAAAGVTYTFTGPALSVRGVRAVGEVHSLTGNDSWFVNATEVQAFAAAMPNPAASILVAAGFPSPITAGVAGNFTLTAKDSSGNTATGYLGTVHFTSSDAQAGLPTDYTFTATDAGQHTFSATLKTAGSQSITATDTAISTIKGSQAGITVNPAAANHFQVNGFPSPDTAGVAHSFTVKSLDAFGNTATGYTGTVAFSSSDSKASLPSPYTYTSSNGGVQTFTGTLMTAGMQSITTSDMATPSVNGTESGISVVASTATVQASIAGPASGVRGQSLSFTLSASESGFPAGSAFSFSIQWGDGSALQTITGPTGTAISHVFVGSGTYSVSLKATDSNGNSSNSVSTSLALTAVAMQTDPYNSNQTALVVGGTTGADTITFSPANSQGGVKVTINGVGQGTFYPTGHIIAFGQSGNDVIKVTRQKINSKVTYVNVPTLMLAEDGNDTLDVSGSTAGNVLVGGAGADSLTGGRGRDILIGGLGADTLHAGSGGDILIGGTTSYDNNASALAAVLAEWSRTDIDYLTRIAQLTGASAGGLNGAYLLNTGTVHSDGSTNYLYGGPGMDWYFAGVLDLLFDQSTGETITPI
jgi:hypothetical protein